MYVHCMMQYSNVHWSGCCTDFRDWLGLEPLNPLAAVENMGRPQVKENKVEAYINMHEAQTCNYLI